MRSLLLPACTAVVCAGSSAYAVCRVIEPSTSQGVRFDPRTTVLVVKAPDQLIAYECPEDGVGDSPSPTPIGPSFEGWIGNEHDDRGATIDRIVPAANEADASPKSDDAGVGSDDVTANVCADGKPALEVRGPLVHVLVQPGIYAEGGTAGLVMPVPRRADVNVAPAGVITALRRLPSSERVRETIEFVEDPSLGYQCSDPHYSAELIIPSPAVLYGCGDDGASDFYRPGLEGSDTSVIEYRDGESVMVEEIPVSADYTVSVLNASSLGALLQWLDDNGLAYDSVDETAFARYVGEDRWFVAVKVHPEDLGGEPRLLEPIVVSYQGTDFPVTHEISYDPDGGVIETDLWVMSENKATVEDGDARTTYAAPFTLDLTHRALEPFGLAQGWLTHLELERRMADSLKRDTLIIDAEDTSEVRAEVEEVQTRVRIAQACCAGGGIPGSTPRTFTQVREYDVDERPSDATLFYVAPAATECAASPYGSDEGGYGLFCAVAGAAWSWSPLLMAFWIVARRRRRLSGPRSSSR